MRIPRRLGVLAALAALISAAALVAPLGTRPVSAASPEASVRIGFRPVLSGFGPLTQVTSAHDGSNRLFIVEKTGRVRVMRAGTLLAAPYLDLSSLVSTSGEQGLLSIAFPPWFATSPQVFVAYTARNGTLVVARYVATSASADTIRTAPAVVLQVPHPTWTNHNGGQLAFGPDRLLYVGTGDGGGAGDPKGNAQNLRVLNGKILRIDPSRSCDGLRYCIPPANQFATSTVYQRSIWLSGLRNPWRFSIDPVTGFVYIGDVGQDRYEEIDVVASGYRWLNMGWSCREGTAYYVQSRCIAGQPYRNPLVALPHPTAESITGGFVYRGSTYAPLMTGLYVFGDFVTGRLWVYRYTGTAVRQTATLPGVTSFGLSDANEIYAVTIGGGLYRMVASPA